jgi:hypothetical protein
VGSGIAIQVGGSELATGTIAHWTSVLAGGRLPATGSVRLDVVRHSAAELLISAAWSIGEAAARGLKISPRELQRRLRATEAADFPGGSEETRSYLAATGETEADMELEVKAAWAASQLRLQVEKSTPSVSRAQVRAYYQSHLRRFAVPEEREVVQTESKTEADAIVARHKMAANRQLLSTAVPETFAIAPHVAAEARVRPAEAAIAAAKLDTLVGPVKQRVDYYVFEVKRILARHQEPLTKVSATIASQLTTERRARAVAAFERSWVRKWSAKTNCRGEYVVMPCRQYRGPRSLELGFGLR